MGAPSNNRITELMVAASRGYLAEFPDHIKD
jgi:hypothetical protein